MKPEITPLPQASQIALCIDKSFGTLYTATNFSFLVSATLSPNSAALIAAHSPPGPPPIMADRILHLIYFHVRIVTLDCQCD